MPAKFRKRESDKKVLDHYTDHAANERTFMAWIRTAISIMAFGFIVEKFDLFLVLMTGTRDVGARNDPAWVEDVGLALVALGPILAAWSFGRFRATLRAISSPERQTVPDYGLHGLLAALIGLAGTVLVAYLLRLKFS